MPKYPICPFYKYEENGKLYCEGAKIKFPAIEDNTTWLDMHCCNENYKICRFYDIIMKKYKE